jgi:formate dehydrogenase-N alpha subunit
MTNSWTDIQNANVIVIMGGNAAEAHPCGFKWVTEAKHNHGAKLVVVDPRFTRSAAVSDFYCPIRPGTDIAFLGGVINYLLSNDKIHKDYVLNFTNASYLIRDGYKFDPEEGLFNGYNAATRTYDRGEWEYQIGADGFALTDKTLQHPRSVYQLLKAHYSRYTPEMVSSVTGSPKDKFLKVCEYIATTANGERTTTFMYALGWTQHSHGSQNIRTAAMIQLLLGNIGVPGGGINALRGHSNVQGYTDIGILAHLIPGYLGMPNDKEVSLQQYLSNRNFKPLQPGQISYWQNYNKFTVSFLKAMYGDNAKAENNYGYDWFPKLDVVYDHLRQFELMHQGKINGYICQGFNPLFSTPYKAKTIAALSKLKWLVSIDPLQTDTARFWENHGDYNDVDPAKIQTEVFMLPSTCFAEDDGSLTNSNRALIWHWAGASPPGEAKTDIDILADLFLRIRGLYQKEGGKVSEPILMTDWSYKDAKMPTPEELLKELNGRALTDLKDASGKVTRAAGKQLSSFAELRDDGSTMAACWIYTGCYTEAGNISARRDNSDPSGKGVHPYWGFAWPANRRILYNRASADPQGKPWSERKSYVYWDGSKWTGADVPDYGPTIAPDKNVGPFIMNPEGVSRLFARKLMAEGPFPEHYEPFETPVGNAFHPKMVSNPAARVFKGDMEVFGKPKEFPYVGTTYRLVEHFHFWTKHNRINAALQPEQFVEISEELAKEKGIQHGGWAKVSSTRGAIKAKVVVTKRVQTLMCGNKPVHVVGVPLHWGFVGVARTGYAANVLTPFVGDANTQAPEYKAFLVDIEPISGPVA